MVWYIRFLKPPKLDPKGHVRALITITTDLGDDFYPTDLTIYAIVVTAQDERKWTSEWQTLKWNSGMRSLWAEFKDAHASPPEPLRLVVNPRRSTEASVILPINMPEFLGVWSDTFDRGKNQAGSLVERRYRTNSGPERIITEETGESIARHVWDAGIALAAYLSTLILQPRPISDLAKLLQRSTPPGPRILELGSGCGIVGLEVAEICSASDILLTDLPAAMEILNHNVERAKSIPNQGKLAAAILDWDGPLPERVEEQRFDLVIVSDCTYNADSIPVLVKTLSAVAENSSNALILVSLKVRHESEAIFFKVMADAGFVEAEHTTIPLPDRQRSETGQGLEAIEFYVYRRQKFL